MFTRAMHSLSFPAATRVALRGDFEGVRRLLDVGGGLKVGRATTPHP